MCLYRIRPEGMGYLLRICWSIESGRTGVKRGRCKLACVSLLFASGLCGESHTAAGARRRTNGYRPDGVMGGEKVNLS